MTKAIFPGILFFLLSLAPLFSGGGGQKTIKIGFNIPLTGDSPKLGESVRSASELVKKSVNDAGGLEVKGKKYMLDFIYADNELKAETAVRIAYRFIERDQVLAVVGPAGSGRAIPAGEIHNENRTPMITPSASNAGVTMNRSYVFRACVLDPVQAPAVVKFAGSYWAGISKTAVLYNHDEDEYSRTLAEHFRKSWEENHGPASVLAYESFGQKDRDFSAQLRRIIGSGAELLYLPVYYNHAALIVTQARELGWGQRPILGSDSWASADLLTLSKGSVVGCYFTTNFAAGGMENTQTFIDAYQAVYGYIPDEVAALAHDSVRLILRAIQSAGITGKIAKDREALKNAIAAVKDFDGVTGKMSFDAHGNPQKQVVVVRVNPSGEFEYVTSL